MTITMNDSHFVSISQIEEFLKGGMDIAFAGDERQEMYAWVESILKRFRYHHLNKKEKGVVKMYCQKMTGYSRAQITRLMASPETKRKRAKNKQKERKLKEKMGLSKSNRFPVIYGTDAVAKLLKTDEAHSRLSGKATKEILKREYMIYGKSEYETISNISVSHIYNLRATRQYVSRMGIFAKTQPNPIPIGERRKPDNEGKPGYIRVDTVHQGDYILGNEHKKGVYHINLVDEITQWEITVSVEKISEWYLLPVLELAIKQYPFLIINFHSDNGSEFINGMVAKLLNKLAIYQTKSRPRHSNDNGLVESKNGAVIRKHFGYHHIAQKHAEKINHFFLTYLNPYLNFHRPSGFATMVPDKKKPGRMKPVYNTYLTPFEKLKTIPNWQTYLKTPETALLLEQFSKQMSDNEAAEEMQKAKKELFKIIRIEDENLRIAMDPRHAKKVNNVIYSHI